MKRRAHLSDLCSECVFILILYTVFAVDLQARDGIVTGKVWWFGTCMPACAVLTSLAWMTTRHRTGCLHLHAADGILAALAALTFLTYRWELDPEPVRLRFFALWLLLWGCLRILTGIDRHWERQAACLATLAGGVEAGLSLLQCYGILPSLHARFPMTGTFYNPGPLGGFMAVVLPAACSDLVRLQRARRIRPAHGRRKWDTALRWRWCCTAAMAVALPATMSRTAWMAAAAGCVVTVWGSSARLRLRITERLKQWLAHRAAAWAAGTALACVILLAAGGLYVLRPASAAGRLWIWRVTLEVMARRPTGVGAGGFPAAYADAQARLLASDRVSAAGRLSADCPASAFNEYLQCGAELGWAGTALMLAGLAVTLRSGWRRHRYGWVGALTALSVFALASYPLQLPSFWMLLAVAGSLSAASTAANPPSAGTARQKLRYLPAGDRHRCRIVVPVGLLLTAVLSAWLARPLTELRSACRDWQFAASLDHAADSTASDIYSRLLPQLDHCPDFLLEYARCLNRMEQFAAADSLLSRASLLSGDPVIRAVRGRNAQAMHRFEDAERFLLQAAAIVPARMYPHYLLVRLYADPLWYHPGKMKQAAGRVLDMQPRILSPATGEMQAEVRALLESKKMHKE